MTLEISILGGSMAKIGRYCLITGKVQGVFYRQATKEQALLRGLTGCVKNLPDGSVEAKLFGDEAQVLTMLEWMAVGPPRAVVSELKVSDIETEQFPSFEIVR
jgi:acylphosphatase